MKRLVLSLFVAASGTLSAAEPVSVALETRVLRIRSEDCKALKLDAIAKDAKSKTLTAAECASLLARMEQCPGVEVVAAPKMIALSGKTVKAMMQQDFPSIEGTTIDPHKGVTNNIVYKKIGLTLELMPVAMKDGRTYVECSASDTQPCTTPVTLMVPPVYEGGSQGVPVPFTTHAVAQAFDTYTLQTSMLLEAGQSILVPHHSRKVQSHIETKIPWLADLPRIGDLFRSEEILNDVEYSFVLVTPQVLAAAPVAAAPPIMQATPAPGAIYPAPVAIQPLPVRPPVVAAVSTLPMSQLMPVQAVVSAPSSDRYNHTAALETVKPIVPPSPNAIVVKVLLEQYAMACQAGDTVKAKAIAAHCLELDPMCFAKK